MSSGSKKGTQIYYPLLSSPGMRIPYRFPNGAPMEIPAYGAILRLSWYISNYLSLRVPGKGAPPCSVTGSPCTGLLPSPEPLVYLFIHSFMYVSRSPPKEALLHIGKNTRSPSTELHADIRPTHNGVRPGSPRGSLTTLLLYPSAMQHSARYIPTGGIKVRLHSFLTLALD